jgi:hypothetical protein
MKTAMVVASLAVGAALVTGGCRRDNGGRGGGSADAREQADRRAQSEGRLTVDQSAVLPVDVRAGVQKEYPGSTVQKVEMKTYNDRVVRYEVQLTTKDGKKVTREFGSDGKPTSGESKTQG